MLKSVAVAIAITLFCLTASPSAWAAKSKPLLGKGTRTVLRTGLYGALGGTAIGLATLPFTQDARSVFIGSSTGLYLGLAVGLILAWEESEPEEYAMSLGLSKRARASKGVPSTEIQSTVGPRVRARPLLYAETVVARF